MGLYFRKVNDMNVSVSLDERSLNDTLRALKKFGKDAERAVKDVVVRTARAVETDAKEKLKADKHIVTGRLRASIHAEIKPNEAYSYTDDEGKGFEGGLKENFGDLEAIAGTNVEYSGKIEGIHSYMRYAGEKQKEPFTKRMVTALNKLIK